MPYLHQFPDSAYTHACSEFVTKGIRMCVACLQPLLMLLTFVSLQIFILYTSLQKRHYRIGKSLVDKVFIKIPCMSSTMNKDLRKTNRLFFLQRKMFLRGFLQEISECGECTHMQRLYDQKIIKLLYSFFLVYIILSRRKTV